jgi:hypothetical protein
MAIPGIAEAGLTMEDLKAGVNPSDGGRQKTALKSEMLAIVRKIEEQQVRCSSVSGYK